MAIVHTREELHDLLKTEREARLAAEKQAEAHLRELEALRKAKEAPAITYVQNWLLNNLKYAAVVTDSAGNIMSINDEFVKLFLLPAPQEAYIGTPLEELEKQTLLSHLIPHREALANGNLYDDATLPDGTVVERENMPLSDGSNHCGTAWFYRDVTTRRQRLRKMELQSELQEEYPNPVLRLSFQGEILFGNIAGHDFLQEVAERRQALQRLLLLHINHLKIEEHSKPASFESYIAKRFYYILIIPIPDKGYFNL